MDNVVWHEQGNMGEREMIYLGLGLVAFVFLSIFLLLWTGSKGEE